MTVGGWIFMLVSVSCVWLLAGWCYYRVLTRPKPSANAPDDRGS